MKTILSGATLLALRINALPILLLALALASSERIEAQGPALQDGDLFVGAGRYGAEAGYIARVRDGNAVSYCEVGSLSFGVPDEVVVDSQGRVVFVAMLGPTASYGFGLFRCNSMGTDPELLGGFSGTVVNTNLPNNPFPDEVFVVVTSLHLAPFQAIVIDDAVNNGVPHLTTEDAYVMAVATFNSMTGEAYWRSIRYHPADGTWDRGPDPGSNGTLNIGDMVFHAGATYSVLDGILRKEKAPLQIKASGKVGNTDFSLSLSLFGGRKEVANIVTDDETNYVDSGCASHDGITDAMPLGGGSFIPMSGFQKVVYDESGGLGLVISSIYVGLSPYLAQVSDALLNDDPSDDKAQMFHDSYLGCAVVPSLHYHRILPAYSSDASLYPWQGNGVDGGLVSSSRGIMGTQAGYPYGRVMHVLPGDAVETVNTSLFNPRGIGAYPAQVSAGIGTVVIVRVDSSANALVTDASGRRIGIDPDTGFAINDFGEDGFDSGPGEPRFVAIKNPAPGPYLVHEVGTGDGPIAIDVYSADLSHLNGNRDHAKGVVSVGSISNQFFTLGADTAVAFIPRPVPPGFGSIHRATNGSVTLVITNMPGLALTVQASGNLADWTTLASPIPVINPYVFTDTTASAEATRFYRAFYP
jgi:hypothetical protein